MSETNGLSLETEQLTAHLMILGWWPCEWTYTWSSKYARRQRWIGIRSQTQVAFMKYGRVVVQAQTGEEVFKDIEWWVLTDEAIGKIANTVDSSLMGW